MDNIILFTLKLKNLQNRRYIKDITDFIDNEVFYDIIGLKNIEHFTLLKSASRILTNMNYICNSYLSEEISKQIVTFYDSKLYTILAIRFIDSNIKCQIIFLQSNIEKTQYYILINLDDYLLTQLELLEYKETMQELLSRDLRMAYRCDNTKIKNFINSHQNELQDISDIIQGKIFQVIMLGYPNQENEPIKLFEYSEFDELKDITVNGNNISISINEILQYKISPRKVIELEEDLNVPYFATIHNNTIIKIHSRPRLSTSISGFHSDNIENIDVNIIRSISIRNGKIKIDEAINEIFKSRTLKYENITLPSTIIIDNNNVVIASQLYDVSFKRQNIKDITKFNQYYNSITSLNYISWLGAPSLIFNYKNRNNFIDIIDSTGINLFYHITSFASSKCIMENIPTNVRLCEKFQELKHKCFNSNKYNAQQTYSRLINEKYITTLHDAIKTIKREQEATDNYYSSKGITGLQRYNELFSLFYPWDLIGIEIGGLEYSVSYNLLLIIEKNKRDMFLQLDPKLNGRKYSLENMLNYINNPSIYRVNDLEYIICKFIIECTCGNEIELNIDIIERIIIKIRELLDISINLYEYGRKSERQYFKLIKIDKDINIDKIKQCTVMNEKNLDFLNNKDNTEMMEGLDLTYQRINPFELFEQTKDNILISRIERSKQLETSSIRKKYLKYKNKYLKLKYL
jgi:hypothetical protein